MKKNIRATTVALISLFLLSLGGTTHAHDHGDGAYVHKHAPVAAGDDSHAKDHEENAIAVCDDGVGIRITPAAKYTAFQYSKDDGINHDGGGVCRAITGIQPPGISPGYIKDAAQRAFKDRLFLISGARRAPPRAR